MINNQIEIQLPGKNCGLCGFQTCNELAERIKSDPDAIKKCILISNNGEKSIEESSGCSGCSSCSSMNESTWKDSLGREYDFLLDSLPGDPGPREIIRLHNPLLTKELQITTGDVIMGRPLGMSCGCPITHCGIVMDVHEKTGVVTWCITGPLQARQESTKDIGFYSAEAYEGIVSTKRVDLKIGMRYYFMPRKCMLQWRHSGLVNFIQKKETSLSIRLEGLWIG